MFENITEKQARKQILEMVAEYCDTFHNQNTLFKPGNRINYASRIYDQREKIGRAHV